MIRAGTSGGDSTGSAGPDLIGAAESLRWLRPDLTGALADHLLATAEVDGDDWLAAAGWAVHARSAIGDGRAVAAEILADLVGRGTASLAAPAARRLRVELATLAAAAGEVRRARRLLAPIVLSGTAIELRADAYCALARCAVEDRPDAVSGALRRAAAAWGELDGRPGAVGSASVALVAAAAERRARRPAAAVARAAEGLALLDRAGGGVRSPTRSGHLTAALAAERISALLDAGRDAEAREVCRQIAKDVAEGARPSRQLALLRLTVARTIATGSDADQAVTALERAATEATRSDAPDLEAICRSTLAALHERAGRSDLARIAQRAAESATARDRSREADFVTALRAALPVAASIPATDGAGADDAVDELQVAWSDGHRDGVGVAVEGAPGVHPTAEREDRVRGWVPTGNRDAALVGTPWSAGTVRDPIDPAAEVVPVGDLPTEDTHARGLRAGPGVRASRHRSDDRWSTRRLSAAGADQDGVGHAGVGVPVADGGGAGRKSVGSAGGGGPVADGGGVDLSPVEPGTVAAASGTAEEWFGESAEVVTAGPSGVEEPSVEFECRRPDEPSATGPDGVDTVPLDVADVVSAGERSTGAEPSTAGFDPLLSPVAVDGTSVDPLPPVDSDVDGWLEAALADLDRLWGPASGETAPAQRAGPQQTAPQDLGCIVVIDVARGGRRFAGPRAGAVVAAVSQGLADRLPRGARLRDEAGVLSIVMPGWERTAATEWMHRTLPAMLAGVELTEELPGAHLRAAVHDADGPVGAQILHRIDRGPHRAAGAAGEGVGGRSAGAGAGVLGGSGSGRSAGAAGGVVGGWSATAHDAGPSTAAGSDGLPSTATGSGWQPPGAGTGGGAPAVSTEAGGGRHAPPNPGGGRHDASGRTPFRLDGRQVRPGSGGRRYRRGPDGQLSASAGATAGPDGRLSASVGATAGPDDQPAAPAASANAASASAPSADALPSTEGLGLADLLAGALAAYRGI